LELLTASYNEYYLPLTLEHDIRKTPIGRVKSAIVERLDDGEFAVKGLVEMFEEGDTLSSAQDDGRKLLIATVDSATFAVEYDSSYEVPLHSLRKDCVPLRPDAARHKVVRRLFSRDGPLPV
jgi:hypothetical protein